MDDERRRDGALQRTMETAQKVALLAERLLAAGETANDFLTDVIAAIRETPLARQSDGRVLALKLGVALVHNLSTLALGVAELTLGDEGDDGDDVDEGDDSEQWTPRGRNLHAAPFALRIKLVHELARGLNDDAGPTQPVMAAPVSRDPEAYDRAMVLVHKLHDAAEELAAAFGVQGEGVEP
jgi:hypothetical protein